LLDEKIIIILIERIKNAKINPLTDKPFKVDDIKIDSYKAIVTERLEKDQNQKNTPQPA
jgi:hypothetical protein